MKMWCVTVIILLLCCYGCLPACDGRPCFSSRNFNNVLHWERVKHNVSREEVLYSVQYWSDAGDQRHHTKAECHNITALSCDLTAETPSISDVHYYAQVFADGRPHGRTYRFKPIAETVLGPPILSVGATVSSLHVNVTLPSGPSGISIADIFNSTKRVPIYPTTLYVLRITHPKWAAQVNVSTNSQFVIRLKNNSTEYCGHVVYKPNFELGRPPSENASFCVTLPGDPWMLFPWFVVLALLLVVIGTISIVYLCRYVKGGKGKSLPVSLVTSFSILPTVQQSLDKNLYISKAEVCPKNEQKAYNNVQVKPKVASVASGGYSPQDIPCQDLPVSSASSVDMSLHGSAPEWQDVSPQSSEIYGAVGVHAAGEETDVSATNKDKGDINVQWPSFLGNGSWHIGGASSKAISHGAAPSPILDSQGSDPAEPLLLHAVRDANGQLLFPTLTFQLQSATAHNVSPPNPGGKLFLSDLVHSRDSLGDWSDSGCGPSAVTTPTEFSCTSQDSPVQPLLPALPTHYQKTQTGCDTFASSYQQNWMPANALGMTPEDSSDDHMMNFLWNWTDTKKEEEEVEEGAGQIFLEGWVVQIQE